MYRCSLVIIRYVKLWMKWADGGGVNISWPIQVKVSDTHVSWSLNAPPFIFRVISPDAFFFPTKARCGHLEIFFLTYLREHCPAYAQLNKSFNKQGKMFQLCTQLRFILKGFNFQKQQNSKFRVQNYWPPLFLVLIAVCLLCYWTTFAEV